MEKKGQILRKASKVIPKNNVPNCTVRFSKMIICRLHYMDTTKSPSEPAFEKFPLCFTQHVEDHAIRDPKDLSKTVLFDEHLIHIQADRRRSIHFGDI
jgi:hypothetical protein